MRTLSYRLVTMTSMHNQPHRIMAFMNQPWSRKSLMSCRILSFTPCVQVQPILVPRPSCFYAFSKGQPRFPAPARDTANRTDS